MDKREIKIKIAEEGYIRANIIFEVIGNPKEYVEKAIKTHIVKLKKEEDIEVINEFVEKAEKQDEYWSTFAEIELLVKGLDKFNWLCLNFMPASVEILEPNTLVFKPRNLTGWLNDLLSKSHEISALSQQLGKQNKMILQNINALMRNTILICLDAKITDPKEIAKKIGVKEDDLAPLFEAMLKEGSIKKEGKKYARK
ncbi:hypothetical protein H8D36_04835 [archaeon]|nr:hypothetical protein [archaeon]MBL7056649.1 hypothetical protein [Candidatus Woesearchaeota archaeon]